MVVKDSSEILSAKRLNDDCSLGVVLAGGV